MPLRNATERAADEREQQTTNSGSVRRSFGVNAGYCTRHLFRCGDTGGEGPGGGFCYRTMQWSSSDVACVEAGAIFTSRSRPVVVGLEVRKRK